MVWAVREKRARGGETHTHAHAHVLTFRFVSNLCLLLLLLKPFSSTFDVFRTLYISACCLQILSTILDARIAVSVPKMRGIGVGGAGQPLPKLRRGNAQRRSGHGRTFAKMPCPTKHVIKIEPVPLHRTTDPDNGSSSPVPDSDKLSVLLQARATTDQHGTSSPAPVIDEFSPVLQTSATTDQQVSSLPVLDSSDVRSDLRAHARTVRCWERLLILAFLLVAILFDVPTSAPRIHEELQRQAQENANDAG